MNAKQYFSNPSTPMHRQFLALRSFVLDSIPAADVAKAFGYTPNTVYTLKRDMELKLTKGEEPFFVQRNAGRKPIPREGGVADRIVELRKQYLSVPQIKSVLDAEGADVSERTISSVLESQGFAKLPRRDAETRRSSSGTVSTDLSAPISERIKKTAVTEEYYSENAGLLCFLPIIKSLGIDKVIRESDYPYTKRLGRVQSILSFVALKLSDISRYSADDVWCMDRGMGMFAGLNVLPKCAWFSSYSSAVTRDMNCSFLHALMSVWRREGMLSDTVNLDFTAIPYWGDDDSLENNWSGKLMKALPSIEAVLAQDSENGILCYGDTTVRHSNQSDVVMEFLDFYHQDEDKNRALKYLVFDSRFTTYANLNRINIAGIKFLTIQRRSKALDTKTGAIQASGWNKVRIERANGRGRNVFFSESTTTLKGYDGPIRQVFIKSTQSASPATVITNEFNLKPNKIIQKYAARWLVEQDISEQIHFFHMNRNTSGIVVKVDFDLVMTILSHNLYRMLARELPGFSHCTAKTLHDKFIRNAGTVIMENGSTTVKLKRKRSLPLLLDALGNYPAVNIPWINDSKFHFVAATST